MFRINSEYDQRQLQQRTELLPTKLVERISVCFYVFIKPIMNLSESHPHSLFESWEKAQNRNDTPAVSHARHSIWTSERCCHFMIARRNLTKNSAEIDCVVQLLQQRVSAGEWAVKQSCPGSLLPSSRLHHVADKYCCWPPSVSGTCEASACSLAKGGILRSA